MTEQLDAVCTGCAVYRLIPRWLPRVCISGSDQPDSPVPRAAHPVHGLRAARSTLYGQLPRPRQLSPLSQNTGLSETVFK